MTSVSPNHVAYPLTTFLEAMHSRASWPTLQWIHSESKQPNWEEKLGSIPNRPSACIPTTLRHLSLNIPEVKLRTLVLSGNQAACGKDWWISFELPAAHGMRYLWPQTPLGYLASSKSKVSVAGYSRVPH